MKKCMFIYFCFALFACTGNQENNINNLSQVLPTFIHEGDSITINLIKDSINIDTDSLFFHIEVFYQDFAYTRGYIKIKNGEGKFKVPENAAYISGFFYNLNEIPDSKEYKRLIYDKKNKPVLNAYQEEKTEKGIEKELLNHPSNFSIYASYIRHLSTEAYLGKVTDSLVIETAQKYLAIVEPRINLNNQNDLYTLAILYINAEQIKKAKKVLLKLAHNSPNSYLFQTAKSHFWFKNENLKDDNEKNKLNLKEPFFDSLEVYFAKEYPYSYESRQNSFIQILKREKSPFSNEVLSKNFYYDLKHKDSTNINLIHFLFSIKLKNKEFDSAYILAEKYLKLAKNRIPQHYLMAQNGRISNNKGTYLSKAYTLFRRLNEQKKEYQLALNYLDSAWIAVQENEKDAFYNPNEASRIYYNHKARLQRKLQQPFAALKTYSELYQELKDERILDSIKLVFEEQDQAADFENYVQNLKDNLKEVKKELKITPEFSIKDTKGNLYTDKNLKGAVVVLNFWGVHCSPCVREIPVMNEFWEATQGHEIVYLAITRDKALAVERFGRRQKEFFKFPVVPSNQEFFDRFGVQLIPTQIIINPKGEIIYTQVGATQDATQNLKKVLEEELEIDNILIE